MRKKWCPLVGFWQCHEFRTFFITIWWPYLSNWLLYSKITSLAMIMRTQENPPTSHFLLMGEINFIAEIVRSSWACTQFWRVRMWHDYQDFPITWSKNMITEARNASWKSSFFLISLSLLDQAEPGFIWEIDQLSVPASDSGLPFFVWCCIITNLFCFFSCQIGNYHVE